MKKYWAVFRLYLSERLALRYSFLMERFRSWMLLLGVYFVWSTVFLGKSQLAGYSRDAVMTYLFLVHLLRSVVLTSRTDEISSEINRGMLSTYLLRPISFPSYIFCRDLSEKCIHGFFTIGEIAILSQILKIDWQFPHRIETWVLFTLSASLALMLYFAMSFMIGSWGFWTAESSGPRFFLELLVEFTAGVFFPLSILSPIIRSLLRFVPSPYLIFYPMEIFLEKQTTAQGLQTLLGQSLWFGVMSLGAVWIWRKGLKTYTAHGG